MVKTIRRVLYFLAFFYSLFLRKKQKLLCSWHRVLNKIHDFFHKAPYNPYNIKLSAEVAELADALGSGSSGRKAVRVRIPPSAPCKFIYINNLLKYYVK